MPTFELSRSSRLYKFVFGPPGKEWGLEGFPEPRNNKVSLGLFIGFLILMIIAKPYGHFMFLMFDALIRILSFLRNGSWARGSILKEAEIFELEPWPRIRGHRISPWPVLVLALVSYRYWEFGARDALEILFYLVLITIMLNVQGRQTGATPVEELTEQIGPAIDEKIRLAYYRESKVFPTLHLTN